METIVGLGPSLVIHDQDIRTSESRLVADLGITEWLSAGIVVPLRVFDTRITYRDHDGEAVEIENPFIHHHNTTLVGLGDPWLLGRASRSIAGFTVGARVGVSIPLGRTEEDPFALGEMGLAHEHSQFGTGTVQPLIGFDVARSFGKLRGELYALSIQSMYRNKHGYQAGDRYAAGFGIARNLGDAFRLRFTGELQAETAERWGGVIQTEEGNTGRVDILAGIEAMYRVTDTWYLGAQAKLPIYTHVDGGQLDMSAYVGLRIGARFELFEGDEHHDHDHGDHHHDDEKPADWTGLDMQAYDATADLVPVAGKLTVFDFWATWCEPCKDLDRELAEFTRAHPEIAVRKIDVADVDSPAYKKHLRDAMIPHVKVFDRTGKLVYEMSAAPHELMEHIEKLVK
jgi:thiol-disulfide isomerase/thioredoxin